MQELDWCGRCGCGTGHAHDCERVRVDRAGRVFITNNADVVRMAGWVDRHGGKPREWRAVEPGGSTHHGFPTRGAAVAFLSGAA